MNKELMKLGLYLIGGILIYYAGVQMGTYRMALAYGEAMSAEALMYLAAKDAEK